MAIEFDEAAILKQLPSVMNDKTLVDLPMSIQEAYLLMQAAQLTITHEGLSQHMRQLIEACGRRCQEAIRPFVTNMFANFMEAGWHREFDR